MENIIKGIRQYYPVSDSSLEVLFSHMEKLELPKKLEMTDIRRPVNGAADAVRMLRL